MLTASSFYRDSNCFANRRMGDEAEKRGVTPPESTYFTRRGTRVHAGKPETRDEKDAYEFTVSLLNSEIQKLIPVDIHSLPHKGAEKRLYLRSGFVPYFSGRPDTFYLWGLSGVVGDLKPGFETDWEAWQAQIICYATLLYENFDLNEVKAIVQTRFYGNRSWTFSEGDLIRQRILIESVVGEYESGAADDKPTNPGPWCRYCKARLICNSALAFYAPTDIAHTELPGGPQGAEIVEKLKLIIKIATDRLAWYKEKLTANPEFIPNWKLAGRKDPSITDTQAALELLKTILPPNMIYPALAFSIPKLRSALRDLHPHLKEHEAKASIDQLLGDLITYKESEKWLAKK